LDATGPLRRCGPVARYHGEKPFKPIEWILLFWIFFAVLFLLGLKVMGAEPWLARVMLVMDPVLVGMAVSSGCNVRADPDSNNDCRCQFDFILDEHAS
jgi:hypothetical protein